MYAAIQGLVEELKERDKEIDELKMKSAEFEAKANAVDTLKAQNAAVQRELRAIREQLSNLPPR
jgi:predicted nuclease with TOPRIM domain